MRRALSAGAAVLALAATGSLSVWAAQPPAPGPARPLQLPAPAERTLANGLRVIVAEQRDVPLVTALLLVRTGSAADPPQRAGLAEMTARLLTRGSRARGAVEIAEVVEGLGGTLDALAGWDGSQAQVTVASPLLPAALPVLAEVVREPAFDEEEIERLRGQMLDQLRVRAREPSTLGAWVASRLLFGAGGYGLPREGTVASLPRITRADLLAFHGAHYRPDHAVLVLSGDLDRDAAFALAERSFGGWARPAGAVAAPPAAPAPAVRRVVAVDLPASGQAAVVVGARALRRADPRFPVALLAHSTLGGSYSARLNQEIRIKRGLSYGARSSFEARRASGSWLALTQTKNESAVEVVELVLEELRRLGSTPAAASELGPRRAVLVGAFARSLETTQGLAQELALRALYELDLGELQHYIPAIEAVEPAALQAVAGELLRPEGTVIVVVGRAETFLPALRGRFPEVEVIPAAELDLESLPLRPPPAQPGR